MCPLLFEYAVNTLYTKCLGGIMYRAVFCEMAFHCTDIQTRAFYDLVLIDHVERCSVFFGKLDGIASAKHEISFFVY